MGWLVAIVVLPVETVLGGGMALLLRARVIRPSGTAPE